MSQEVENSKRVSYRELKQFSPAVRALFYARIAYPDEMQEHLRDLCKQHRIEMKLNTKMHKPSLSIHDRFIVCKPVETQLDYFIALHQIGLVLFYQPQKSRLCYEGEAWQYAVDNTISVLSPNTKYRISRYLQACLTIERQRTEDTLDLPSNRHCFWKLANMRPPDPLAS